MNKTSGIFIVVGIIILGVLGYYFISTNKTKTQTDILYGANTAGAPAPDNKLNAPVEVVFEYKQGAAYEPKSVRVEQGQQVVVKVTSSVADEAHFHGYDLSTELKAGQQGAIDFTANQTGRFELELEGLKQTLGFIEIYPK